MDGGRDFYLSPLDKPKFEEMVRERADDLNCITSRDAILIATDLILSRRKIAAMLLQAALVDPPRSFMDITAPCHKWLTQLTRELRLRICSTRELEDIRREFCDHEAIAPFFAQFQTVIKGRDPRLVFSMHEEQLSVRKTLLTLAGIELLSRREAETKLSHITGMCTVAASGDRFRPIVILKQFMGLESLAQFSNLASFASSSSGWITSDLFAMFAIDFCAQLGWHRLSLPSTLAQKPALLILADDISRMNIVASIVFRMCNVDVLILPGRTAQALHPVARSISRSLNQEFKYHLKSQLLGPVGKARDSGTEPDPVNIDTIRCSMVAKFLNAFHRETIPEKVQKAFEATGFVPFNPDRPRESWASEHPPTGEFDALVARPNSVQARLLTDCDDIAARFAAHTGRQMTQDDCELKLDEVWNGYMGGDLDTGRVLSPRPGICIMMREGESRYI
jgi:hypothetical protein